MANHSTGDQVSYVLQWFNSWSEFQRDDFVHCMASKINPEPHVNGISNGLQSLDASGRPPTLFTCQLKLFNEWWPNWSEVDKERFTRVLKESNPEFWSEIEAEMNGTRKKSDDDFFTAALSDITDSKKAELKSIEIAQEAVEEENGQDEDESVINHTDVSAIEGDNGEAVIPEPMAITAEYYHNQSNNVP